jgi:hypothetical protein
VAEGRKKNGETPKPPSEEPAAKAQRNFIDPDSRILLTKDGYIQGYNAQAAVDGAAQVIVARTLTPGMNDQGQLVPLVEGIGKNLGRKPKQASADAGYCSEANLEALAERGIGAYITLPRGAPNTPMEKNAGPAARSPRPCGKNSSKTDTAALLFKKTDRGAGVRADQASQRLPPVPAARHRQGARLKPSSTMAIARMRDPCLAFADR